MEMDLDMTGVSGTSWKQDNCCESKSSSNFFSVSGNSLPLVAKLENGFLSYIFLWWIFSKKYLATNILYVIKTQKTEFVTDIENKHDLRRSC